MPIAHYGVLKGRSILRRLATGLSPHYQILLVDNDGTHFRAAINARSQVAPSEVMFYVKPFFVHPVTAIVQPLASGFHPLASGQMPVRWTSFAATCSHPTGWHRCRWARPVRRPWTG